MRHPIHIVAIGARTPVGLTAASTAAAVRARISRVAEHPFLSDVRGEPVHVARDALLDPGFIGAPRLLTLARTALQEVVAHLGLSRPEASIPLFVGLPELRPGWTPDDVDAVARELKVPAEAASQSTTKVLPDGHSAALAALKQAVEMLQRRQAEICIVGGVDSYLHPKTLMWLDTHRQLLRAGMRSAFSPGEGAGFLALAGEPACHRLGLKSLGLVADVQVGYERKLIKTGEVNIGEGLSQVIGAAAAEARRMGKRIDDVYCDLNGERYRTEEWGFALLRTQGDFRDGSAARMPASEWGEMGAASGALLAILATQAWERRYAKGPVALVWTSSEGGLRAALLLKRLESGGSV